VRPTWAEVLDFVEFLEDRSKKLGSTDAGESAGWSAFSLSQMMRDVEDEEELYSLSDLKEAL
jgi:hypothetical protein